jgi:hypothetical protein
MPKKPTYIGSQYKGGRTKGKTNLKKLPSGRLKNKYGVIFSPTEKKKLESLVNSANRKRKRMLEQEGELPFVTGGKETGLKLKEVGGGLEGQKTMGRESDFVLAKKTKSLQRFRNKLEYKRYIANLERVTDRNYVKSRVMQYKENHIKGIRNMLGKYGKDIIKEIEKMDIKEYMKRVQSDELLEINYIYAPQQQKDKAEQMRTALNMK